jgi:hypothetical protein
MATTTLLLGAFLPNKGKFKIARPPAVVSVELFKDVLGSIII